MVTAVCNSAGHPLPANGHSDAIMGLHVPATDLPTPHPGGDILGPQLLATDSVPKCCIPWVGPNLTPLGCTALEAQTVRSPVPLWGRNDIGSVAERPVWGTHRL